MYIEIQSHVKFAIELIGEILSKGIYGQNPTQNTGVGFINDVFKIRAESWDDEGNEGDLDYPYNFEWKDLKVTWYKHINRGAKQNRAVSFEECTEMVNQCLFSIKENTVNTTEQSIREIINQLNSPNGVIATVIARRAAKLIKELWDDISHAVSEAKRRSPDYPYIHNDAKEAVWALGSAYEGACLACDDLHKEISRLKGDAIPPTAGIPLPTPFLNVNPPSSMVIKNV